MPSIMGEFDSQVVSGSRPSGELGWSHLVELTKRPHPYNSPDNLRINSYLKTTLESIKNEYSKWGCTQVDQIEVYRVNSVC
jgi:hypothetical protein